MPAGGASRAAICGSPTSISSAKVSVAANAARHLRAGKGPLELADMDAAVKVGRAAIAREAPEQPAVACVGGGSLQLLR